MRIDLTCPVELRRCSMPSPEYPVCEMDVFNLAEKAVSSVQVCLLCFDENGEQTARCVERVQVAEAPSREMFRIDTVAQEAASAAGMDVVFDKVWFEDGTVWRRGSGSASEFQPTPMLQDERLRVMQELAGTDAITYPSDQGGVWVCVCGRPNAASADVCRRCGRDKHNVFVKYNEAAVEKIIFQRESAREEAERAEREENRRRAEEKKAQLKKKKHRRRVTVTVCVTTGLLLVIAAGTAFFGYPWLRSGTAGRWFENGRWDDAKAVYQVLNDSDFYWKNVYHYDYNMNGGTEKLSYADMILECDYRKALSALRNGTLSSLQAAREAFETEPLASWRDSAEQAMQARYQYAQKLTEQENWEQAIAAWGEISGYLDSAERLNAAKYSRAGREMDAHDYETARAHFLELGTYSNAALQADECLRRLALEDENQERYTEALAKYAELGSTQDIKRVNYTYGEKLMDEENYEEAIARYTLAEDWQETGKTSAGQRLKEACYLRADQLYSQGDFASAALYFDRAGEYRDAVRRGKYQCRYAPAVAMMAEGRYTEAEEIFRALGNYEDSAAQREECVYLEAARLHGEGADEEAIALLEGIPGHEKAEQLRRECILAGADRLLADGKNDEALAQYLLIRDFKTEDRCVEDTVQDLMYKKGIECMNGRDWVQAAELFASIPGYKDADENLRSSSYSMAIALKDSGEYARAAEIFGGLGKYENAEEYCRQAQYSEAARLEKAGEYAEAAALYELLGSYQESGARLIACTVKAAEKLEESGAPEEAYLLLDGVAQAKEAQELRGRLGYALAAKAEETGDLYEAASLFDSVSYYQDAGKRAESCRDRCYADAFETVAAAMKAKDWRTVTDTLDDLDMNALGEKYASLEKDYQEACYQLANELWDGKKYFEAYAYYTRIPDYKDVTSKKLNRVTYFLIGTWEGSRGEKMEFRADGTCNIDGKEGYYFAPNKYSLQVGDREESRKAAYEISTAPTRTGSKMTLRRNDSRVYYYMTRVTGEADGE